MGKGRAASRKVRVYVFREWLLQTYGSYLSGEMARYDCSYSNENMRKNRKRKREKPSIVLDVAGGKGDLSWLLQNVDGIESIVLDPWQPDPKSVSRNERMVKSIEYLRKNPEEQKKRSVPFLPTYQPLASLLPRLLEERRKRLRNKKQAQSHHIDDNEDVSPTTMTSTSAPTSKENEVSDSRVENPFSSDTDDGPCRPQDFLTPRILHVPMDETMVQRVRNRIMDEANQSKSEITLDTTTNTEGENNTATDEDDALLDLLTSGNIKLVMGFHPDQATEPCIDLARILGIPYCVVPCCVFPSEFPNRRVREVNDKGDADNEGQQLVPVRTYQQFLDYLKTKASTPISMGLQLDIQPSKMHTSYLDFPFTETAKNIVLYSLPP